MREDASDKRDNEERFRNCIACDYAPPSLECFYLHRRKCQSCVKKAIEMREFVQCPYCEYASSNIKIHLKKKHLLVESQMDKIETCSPNYRSKISESVRNAIMSSSKELSRRSKLLGELNKTEDFRKRASKTAIKTSSKKEIQIQRAERLKRWREENSDTFKNKCWIKMIKADKKWKKTKPELFMISWLNEKYGDLFEWGKMLRSNRFKQDGKSDRKQVDFRSKDRNIFIEIDGPFHFDNLSRQKEIESSSIIEAIDRAKKRDSILENIVKDKNKTLIRVGYGSWCNSTGRVHDNVLDKISEIVDSSIRGIFKIGDIYGQDNCL
jgi:very-short-patch-repair endonuclease